MQQRQLRLGDILDDYCPRERRADESRRRRDDRRGRQADALHDVRRRPRIQARKVPRQRKKSDAPATLYSPVASATPKKVVHDPQEPEDVGAVAAQVEEAVGRIAAEADDHARSRRARRRWNREHDEEPGQPTADEGPVHRPLIRAQLPRVEGQPPAPRQAPDFTIRQPGGRNNRFRPRQQRGGRRRPVVSRAIDRMAAWATRVAARHGRHGGRPPLMSHLPKRHGSGGRKRSK